MKGINSKIKGHLDIIIADNEDEEEGVVIRWQDILIHGNPEGLKPLARILIELADLNQEDVSDLPIGAREHVHLRPNLEISKSIIPTGLLITMSCFLI